ncbi:MAG: hypothetical protein ACI8ZB_005084, partial [Desulforhopalus sp.]
GYTHKMDNKKILVLGIGNILLHDEGIGVYAVRDLEEQYTFSNGVIFSMPPLSYYGYPNDTPERPLSMIFYFSPTTLSADNKVSYSLSPKHLILRCQITTKSLEFHIRLYNSLAK